MCHRRFLQASRAIGRVVENNSGCRRDGDCVWINPRTECGGSCGSIVNRRRLDRVKRRIERIDRRICGDYEEDGCSFERVYCALGIVQPGCVDNRCTGVSPTLLPSPALLINPARIKQPDRP